MQEETINPYFEQLIDQVIPESISRDSDETLPPPGETLSDNDDEPIMDPGDTSPQQLVDSQHAPGRNISEKPSGSKPSASTHEEREKQLVERVKANIQPAKRGRFENMLLVKEIQKRLGSEHVFELPQEVINIAKQYVEEEKKVNNNKRDPRPD